MNEVLSQLSVHLPCFTARELYRTALGMGIYAIVNSKNSKAYVGSAKDISQRWMTHRKTLRGNRHDNRHLQGAWNIYSENAFVFIILETVESDIDLVDREQHWIDALQSSDEAYGYNLRKIARSNLGIRFTAEQRRRLSLSRIGNKNAQGFKQSETTIAKRRQKLIGQVRNFTAESRAKLAESMRAKRLGQPGPNPRTYGGLISPAGVLVGPIHNLHAFCRKLGLNRGNLQMVINGKRRSHRGWTAVAK
jgi:group I intron endonuclease